MANYIDKAYFLTKITAEDLKRITANDGEYNEQAADANLLQAIKEASDEMDSCLRNVTTNLPLTTVPENVKLVTYWIAVYILHDRSQPDDMPEKISRNYDKAARWMRDVATGVKTLNLEVPAEELPDKYLTEPSTTGKMSGGMF